MLPHPDSPASGRASRLPPQSRRYRWLAVLPGLVLLCGVPFANRSRPFILGLPPLLAWIVGWALGTSAIMALIVILDRRHDR